MYQNGEEAYPLPATEVAQTISGNVEYWDRDSTLMQTRKPLLKLQELGIFRLGELLNKKGKRLLSAQDIARNLGIRSMKTKYVTSLNEVAKFLASQDYLNGAASAARGYNVDSEHVRWIRRKLDGEAAHRPPPPNTLKACYEKATWAQLHQKTVELSCGGKREHAIAFDPQLRQSDPVLTADGKTDIGSSEQNRPDSNACGQRHLEIGEPETDDCTLTRKQRASQLLSKKVPPQTVYNLLCAYKDSVKEVSGAARMANHHTKWRKKQRRLLTSQIQWEVHWAPAVLESWEKSIAIDSLGYKPALMRPATAADMQNSPNLVCERCHGDEGTLLRCNTCHRGYHQCCPTGRTSLVDGKCWECQRYDHYPESLTRERYEQEVQQWYIEWEPKWENADTLKALGYEEQVNKTMEIYTSKNSSGVDGGRQSARSKPPKDQHLTNREKQGNQGPRLHSTIGEDARQRCTFVTEDTDPHADIVGTGRFEIQYRQVLRRYQVATGNKKDYEVRMVCIHDPAGRTVGMMTQERLALLYHNYEQVMKTRSDLVKKLKPKTFAEEVASLVKRYKTGQPVPGTNRRVDLTNHWATPPGIYDTFKETFPGLRKERFASPLNYHSGMQQYWSCFERDQLFGAMHDAYTCQWTGYSVANPEYESKEMYKAVSWAVHSAQNTETPTLTLFVLPAWTEGSNTAYMKWAQKMPDTCRLLATIPRKSFKFIQPQAATLGIPPEDTGHPKWDINILAVGNAAGYNQCFPDTEASSSTFNKHLIQAVNQHAHPSTPLTWGHLQHHWPDHSAGAKDTEVKLDSILYRPPDKIKSAPCDQSLPCLSLAPSQEHMNQLAEQQLELTKAKPLKYNWQELVYTDGSQRKAEGREGRKTVTLGSGLYVPATASQAERFISIQAAAPTRHNTAYRAELIAILGALKLGYSQIMTDSVNSIYSIKAAIYYPANTRFHRHKNLLEEIKAAALATGEDVMLIKVRGHAGIPGNEHADDIATTVAATGQAEVDLSTVESNSRPLQVWPVQKTWEEDELSQDGMRVRWKQIENLDDALSNRVHASSDYRELRLGKADTSTVYYKGMQTAVPCMADKYMDTWVTLNGITEGMKNTRVKYLTGQLPTAKNLQRYGKCRSNICPCCKKHPDGGHHAVAWCPAVSGLVQEKHNKAVRIITKAIAQGDMGADSIVYNDGGSASKWARAGVAELHRTRKHIPRDLISQKEFQGCNSRPDIILYRRRQIRKTPEGQWRTTPAVVMLVEIKYTRDTDPSRTMRDPFKQHSELHKLLRERHPSATIERRSIILGVAGALYKECTIRQLELLGVRGTHLHSTAHKLQRHAIQALHETWKARQEKIYKGPANEPGNRASPVGRPQFLGGGVRQGGREGGDERDVGGGARRAEATGEG